MGGPLGEEEPILRVYLGSQATFGRLPHPAIRVSVYYPVTTHECPCVLARHTTGIASPWCADRLPSDISKMSVSTVSAGGPILTIHRTVVELFSGLWPLPPIRALRNTRPLGPFAIPQQNDSSAAGDCHGHNGGEQDDPQANPAIVGCCHRYLNCGSVCIRAVAYRV